MVLSYCLCPRCYGQRRRLKAGRLAGPEGSLRPAQGGAGSCCSRAPSPEGLRSGSSTRTPGGGVGWEGCISSINIRGPFQLRELGSRFSVLESGSDGARFKARSAGPQLSRLLRSGGGGVGAHHLSVLRGTVNERASPFLCGFLSSLSHRIPGPPPAHLPPGGPAPRCPSSSVTFRPEGLLRLLPSSYPSAFQNLLPLQSPDRGPHYPIEAPSSLSAHILSMPFLMWPRGK